MNKRTADSVSLEEHILEEYRLKDRRELNRCLVQPSPFFIDEDNDVQRGSASCDHIKGANVRVSI